MCKGPGVKYPVQDEEYHEEARDWVLWNLCKDWLLQRVNEEPLWALKR